MGYDISLVDEKTREEVKVKNHKEGGIIVIGGSKLADISVTYNYSKYYYEHLDEDKGIRWIYNKKYDEIRDRLEGTISILGTNRSNNYWESTPGNAGHIVAILLEWSRQNPDAVFEGD